MHTGKFAGESNLQTTREQTDKTRQANKTRQTGHITGQNRYYATKLGIVMNFQNGARSFVPGFLGGIVT